MGSHMKTLAELERLEQYITSNRVPGEPVDHLVTAFNSLPKYLEPTPLYKETGGLRKYLQWVYDEIQGSRFLTGREPLPEFNEWLGEEWVKEHLN